jgi:transposase-like protein
VKFLRPTHPYIKVNGRWCYLYRAIDRFGALVDVRLSEKRDMDAAKAFFRSAKAVTGVAPARVTTDGHDSYPRAIHTELDKGVKHWTNQYLTDVFDKTFFAERCYFLPARVTAWPRAGIGTRARHAA